MSRYRIVVADQAEAVFYDTASLSRAPRKVMSISDPVAHQHERELASDRPGRCHPSTGAVRHAFGPEPRLRRMEATKFARRIARRLDEARRNDEFDELILVAGARFLGVIRQQLSRTTMSRVVHEIPKDLVHSPYARLRQQLRQDEALASRA